MMPVGILYPMTIIWMIEVCLTEEGFHLNMGGHLMVQDTPSLKEDLLH